MKHVHYTMSYSDIHYVYRRQQNTDPVLDDTGNAQHVTLPNTITDNIRSAH